MSSAMAVSSHAHLLHPYAVAGLMRVAFLRAEYVDVGAGGVGFLIAGVVALLDAAWRVPDVGDASGMPRVVLCVPRGCVVPLHEAVAKLGGGPLASRPGLSAGRAQHLCFVRVKIHRAGPGGTAVVSPVLPAVEVGTTPAEAPIGPLPLKAKKPGKGAPKRYEYPWLQESMAWCDFSVAVPHAQLVWSRKADAEEVGAGELLPTAIGRACDALEGVA